MNRVDGKIVLVTGGGSGLGKASCELLAKAGASVVVSDINLIAAEETVKTIIDSGGEAVEMQHDVVSETDWQQVVDFTLERYGRLDVLVNNAGISATNRGCLETSLEEWRKVHSINLDGTFLGVRIAMGTMRNNKQAGSIINISSISALSGGGMFSYSSSKGAVRSLTRAAAIECGAKGYNIRVNAIYPGDIETPMIRRAVENGEWAQETLDLAMKTIPMGRMAQPIEIAKGVLFLASDDSSYMTGSDLVIDGGHTAGHDFSPERFDRVHNQL